mmetsp:Transcript_34358/g.85642  ORF Transcript_34358/g.85642 Transcript_34358/m.85642 type:complete len:332 (-) Transcript_34358:521-1516(-)
MPMWCSCSAMAKGSTARLAWHSAPSSSTSSSSAGTAITTNVQIVVIPMRVPTKATFPLQLVLLLPASFSGAPLRPSRLSTTSTAGCSWSGKVSSTARLTSAFTDESHALSGLRCVRNAVTDPEEMAGNARATEAPSSAKSAASVPIAASSTRSKCSATRSTPPASLVCCSSTGCGGVSEFSPGSASRTVSGRALSPSTASAVLLLSIAALSSRSLCATGAWPSEVGFAARSLSWRLKAFSTGSTRAIPSYAKNCELMQRATAASVKLPAALGGASPAAASSRTLTATAVAMAHSMMTFAARESGHSDEMSRSRESSTHATNTSKNDARSEM